MVSEYAELIIKYGGIDRYVVETAAMAHDLGHPPFGHVGEEALDALILAACDGKPRSQAGVALQHLSEGFEGNAQSFRVVTKLARRDATFDGLDLTCASLAAICKYPWPRAERDKFGHEARMKVNAEYNREWTKFNFYRAEKREFDECRSGFLRWVGPKEQTLEASIMDVADDITYAIHSLEESRPLRPSGRSNCYSRPRRGRYASGRLVRGASDGPGEEVRHVVRATRL